MDQNDLKQADEEDLIIRKRTKTFNNKFPEIEKIEGIFFKL